MNNSEEPETFHFLAARESTIPLKSPLKPALKVLSRKPAPKTIQKVDPVTGLAKLTVEDEDEEEEVKDRPTAEELRVKAQREREEKQRRYDEARARILGTGAPIPGAVTPPEGRGKGRGRGGVQLQENRRPNSQSGSGPKELFDPNYTSKPGGVSIQKRNGEGPSRSGNSTPREDDQLIRKPRGPDASGKGFAKRGGKS
jgi:hypothetical protein